MKAAALWHGVRVFAKQVRCDHELKRASVTVVGGACVPVRVCQKCGWTDLNPLVW